jgi:NhaC family Na+:H+ antiporter
MGVAQGLGISLPMSAGAIISGALVGEKLSPISGTTILTAASTNTNLTDHIVSMMNTTIPASVVSLALFTYLGWHNAPASNEIQSIATVLAGLHDNFVIHPVLLVPPLFVLGLSAMRKPAIPVFVGGIALGVVMALVVQRASLIHVLNSGMDGFRSNTGVRIVDALLSRGGVASMSFNLYLCLCAGIFAGILDQQGTLTTLLRNLLSYTRTIGGLVLSTTVACLALMFGGAGQFCTLTLPGIAFRRFYDDRDVHSCVLSRTMEDCGTMVGAIIPWDVSALYYASVLGVSMYAYAPYAFMAWMPPFVSIACAYIGLGAFRRNQRVRPLVFRSRNGRSV